MNHDIENTSSDKDEEEIDIRNIIAKVFNNWYLFLIGVVLCLAIAVLYASYATPSWKISGKILVEDPKKGSSGIIGGDLGSNPSSFFNAKSSADNEVQILRSRSLMRQLISDLRLNIRIYVKQGLKTIEVFERAPFIIQIEYKTDSLGSDNYEVQVLDDKSYKISSGKEVIESHARFGSRIATHQYNLILNTTGPFQPAQTYKIVIQSVDEALAELSLNYSAELSDQQSSTIDLNLYYGNPKKGEVILENLLRIYLQSSLLDKDRIADSTMTFINQRLEIVGSELSGIEKGLQQYKQENNLTDISSQSKVLIESSSDYVNKLNDQNVQLAVLTDLQDYLNMPGNRRIVPSSLTTKDASFGLAINAYNELVLNREKLKLSYTDENPVVQNVDQQIESARQNLVKSLETYRNGLKVSHDELAKQNTSFAGQIKSIPRKERVFLDYSRQQNLKQELYLFLMQKREETAITKTSTISSSRIIDHAKSDYYPVKPRKTVIYIVGLFLGIILPAIFLFIKESLNVKVTSKHDVDRATGVPIIGQINHDKSEKPLVVESNSRSIISEQFRSLRTNLQYVLDNSKPNVMLFTSAMSAEGKSFLSLNLGSALALSGKKVVFLELDLRKPKLSNNIGINSDKGYTDFVVSDAVEIQSLLKPVSFNENCWLISSGPIPPNPSELLMSPKLGMLIDELKKSFDFIIIDCPPIGIVTDALVVEKYADITFYVIRQDFTLKSQLPIVNDLKKNKKVKKLYLIINDITLGEGAYGVGYGYGNKGYI